MACTVSTAPRSTAAAALLVCLAASAMAAGNGGASGHPGGGPGGFERGGRHFHYGPGGVLVEDYVAVAPYPYVAPYLITPFGVVIQ
jgi:hypothetical protein